MQPYLKDIQPHRYKKPITRSFAYIGCIVTGGTCWSSVKVSRLCSSECLTFVLAMEKVETDSSGDAFSCTILTLGLNCAVMSELIGVFMDGDGTDFLHR